MWTASCVAEEGYLEGITVGTRIKTVTHEPAQHQALPDQTP